MYKITSNFNGMSKQTEYIVYINVFFPRFYYTDYALKLD